MSMSAKHHWRDLRFKDEYDKPVAGPIIYKAVCEHYKAIIDDPQKAKTITADTPQVKLLAANFAIEFTGQSTSQVIETLLAKQMTGQATPEDKQKLALCIRLNNAGVESF